MLSLTVFLPVLGLLVVLLLPARSRSLLRLVALVVTAVTLALAVGLWLGFEPGGGYQYVQRLPWIERLGVGYSVGIDGLSLVLILLTALLFLAATVFSWDEDRRPKEYYGWLLFLETACLGVFAALDLFLFYVFWDLTLVGMYFMIAIWGHEGARAAALKFFIYTLVGSLALLLGVIVLYLAVEPMTMDMVTLTEQRPLADGGWLAVMAFFALLIGFGIKIPIVPVHTWLPPAHADAPAAGSAILAGIMLKMGTYGLIRIMLMMMPDTFARFAPLVIVLGVLSVIYGVLVALAQTDLKRLIAYTSVNHMGYIVMAIGAVAWLGQGSDSARVLALNGAILQMLSHGLITGALFLLAGVIWRRTHTFDLDRFGGLGKVMPVYAALFGLAAFGSLGLPGLSGFIAEFQIFVGSFQITPWAVVIAVFGIVLTAGLMLWTLQRLFMGPMPIDRSEVADLYGYELLAIVPLLVLVVVIGLLPMWLLAVIDPTSQALVEALPGR